MKEVERVGRDSVYWVRREASFALGALAKVVREDVVITSLVCFFYFLSFLCLVVQITLIGIHLAAIV